MAKASIEIVCEDCGQRFTHSKICYNRRDADDYEAWASTHITICPACWRKAQEDEKIRKALEIVSGHELPALEGSEKQIAWAEKIRAEMIGKYLKGESSKRIDHIAAMTREDLDAMIADWKAKPGVEEWCSEHPAEAKAYMERSIINKWIPLHETSAKWFIDNRF